MLIFKNMLLSKLSIINLILAFTIKIISHVIEYLNMSTASIVRIYTEMHVVLYVTIDVYTAIMKNCLSISCVAQWVEHVNIYSEKLLKDI